MDLLGPFYTFTAASHAVSIMDYSLNPEAVKAGDGQEVKIYHPCARCTWPQTRENPNQIHQEEELFESQ